MPMLQQEINKRPWVPLLVPPLNGEILGNLVLDSSYNPCKKHFGHIDKLHYNAQFVHATNQKVPINPIIYLREIQFYKNQWLFKFFCPHNCFVGEKNVF
jgi:hypothetical protein